MKRLLIAIATAGLIGLSFAPTAASARFGGGGFHGGGFHGGGFGGFRGGGFHHGGFHGGFRRFGPGIGLGLGLGYGLGYPYYASAYGYDGCVRPRRIWTAYGWRVRLVNVCYAYY
jgi:hypothetical protein